MLIFIIILLVIGVCLYGFSFFMAQTQGLSYKTNARIVSIILISIAILSLIGHYFNNNL